MNPMRILSSKKEGSDQEVVRLTGANFQLFTLLEKLHFQTSVGLFAVLFLYVGLAIFCGSLWVKVSDVESRNEILHHAVTSYLSKSDAKNPDLGSILTDVSAISGDSRTVSPRQHIREGRGVAAAPRGGTIVLFLNIVEVKLSHRNEVIGPFQVNGSQSVRLYSDTTSMTVMEESIFSDWTQPMYHNDLSNNGPHDTDLLGYQTTLTQKSNDRIQSIVECVTPRLLKDSYAICFMSVTRLLEVGGQLQVTIYILLLIVRP